MGMLDDLSSLFFNNRTNDVRGITPPEDLSALGRMGLAASGPSAMANYSTNYNNALNTQNLQGLGQDMASGKIDQAQYLKSIAQYDPETYNKIAMAQVQNMPAPVKTYNDIQQLKDAGLELLKKGDHAGAQEMYDRANTLMAVARPQAYGINTFTLPSDGNNPTNMPAVPSVSNPNAVQSAPVADLTPQGSPTPQVAPQGNWTTPASIPAQMAANAGMKKGAETKADLTAKAGDSATNAEEIYNKLSQNLDAMEAQVKAGGVPSSKYFAPASTQAYLARTLPILGEGDVAKNYTAFDSLNAPAALNVLGEMAKGGNIRMNKTIAGMVKDGFMVDPDLSDPEKLVKIATIRAELQNAATAPRNVANRETGQPTQAYTPMPSLSPAAVAAGDGDYAGKLDMTDPKIKQALDNGHTPEQILASPEYQQYLKSKK